MKRPRMFLRKGGFLNPYEAFFRQKKPLASQTYGAAEVYAKLPKGKISEPGSKSTLGTLLKITTSY